MVCPNCGSDSDSSQRFCVSCGTTLSTSCPECGTPLPDGAQFCGSCGSPALESARHTGTVDVDVTPLQLPPESFHGGRYAVKSFLGQGAKKRVYLVDDTLVGREVAFALIMTEGLDDIGRERIRREARAMGQLGDHPNLVQLYDMGEEDGQPFMVLPVMTGGSVDELIRGSPDNQMPLDQVIDMAGALCRGLAFAHLRGFIHRDLKPSNVWLTQEGTPKIGDFGLAVSATDSRITQENIAVGTVAYMPPEQVMGGEVGEHSDLYSLGATLYEMVTGRPPFLGDTLEAIIGQHINTPPVAPGWHNSACPKGLESLILRLLEKDPTSRPESADAVLNALEELERGATSERMPAALADANALDSLAGGVFAGRQDEVGQMKDALESALSGRGRLIMLAGEPGAGKTRTAQELAVYAGIRGAQVVWGRCYEGDGAPPYWPWVQTVRSVAETAAGDDLRSAMGVGAPDIAEIVPEVRQRLGDIEALPALDDPQQARFRLFDSMATFFKGIARGRLLVLVLDDLHEADRASLLLLEFLAREIGTSRLLVIGTYRDAELTRRHPLSQSLGELAKESVFHRIQLRGMSREDVERFIELTAGTEPSSSLVSAVYSHTEGNPLFVNEVVRLLVQEGELDRGELGVATTDALRIPEGVREAIGRRLDRLSEDSNQVLTVASVIGRSFSLDQLVRLIEDQTEDRLLEALDEALAARIIEELPQTVGHYQFNHALVQHTLADELSTTRRVRLHARIADALEDLYGADADAHSEEIAHHLTEAASAGRGGKLVHYALTAGEQAMASHAHEEAVTHFERALSAKEDGPADAEKARLLFGLGRAQAAILQWQEALDNMGRAMDYYVESGDVAQAVAIAGHPLPSITGLTGATDLIARALELVPVDSHDAARLLVRYGLALHHERGDYAGAKEALGRALETARREGDTALEVQALANAADMEAYELQYPESMEHSMAALELAGSVDEPHAEVRARFWASMIAMCLIGDLEMARSHAEASLPPAERLRNGYSLPRALWVNEMALQLEGRWEEALEINDRALALTPKGPILLGTRSIVEYELGNPDSGEAYLQRLIEAMGDTTPGPTFEYGATAVAIPAIGRIRGSTERFDMAESVAEAILSSPSMTPIFGMLATIGLALMAVERGEAEQAAKHYDKLSPAQGTMLVGGIAADRLLGLLAMTADRLDEATAHFEGALALCERAGFRPEQAWTACDYATALLRRNGPGDAGRAAELLDRSVEIAEELGMVSLMERGKAKRDAAQTGRSSCPTS